MGTKILKVENVENFARKSDFFEISENVEKSKMSKTLTFSDFHFFESFRLFDFSKILVFDFRKINFWYFFRDFFPNPKISPGIQKSYLEHRAIILKV